MTGRKGTLLKMRGHGPTLFTPGWPGYKECVHEVNGWLFNGTSTQKGQYVPAAACGGANRLSRLKMANDRDIMHITLRYTITM